MYIAIVILSVLWVLLGLAYLKEKTEIRRATIRFGKARRNLDSEQRITLDYMNKDLDHLAKEINRYIEEYFQQRRSDELMLEQTRNEITNLSHDLRTPLTSLIGYVDLIDESKLDDETRKYLRIIRARSQALKERIGQLVDYSMYREKDFEMTLDTVDLYRIFKEYLLGSYDEIAQKNIVFDFSLPEKEEAINVLGNEKYIGRVLDNLLSNSLKYSGGYLHLALQVENGKAQILFRNRRGDLSDVDIDSLFDRFYRKNQDSKETFGSGLGLAIVELLMTKMNGRVEAKADCDYLDIVCTFTVL